MSDDVKELARIVIEVLDMQVEYFKSRNNETLATCKQAERDLRRRCKAILDDAAKPPSLFD